MIVSETEKLLHISADNDLNYMLEQLPALIEHKKKKLPEKMKVKIELDLNGSYSVTVPSFGGTPVGKKLIQDFRSRKKLDKSECSVCAVQCQMTLTLQFPIRLEYTLGACTGEQVADDIRERVNAIHKRGEIKLRQREPEDA